VNRRLLLAGALVAVLGGGVAGVASADTPALDSASHKVCVDHQVLMPNGFCVVWDDPLGSTK
jgi:hypothetical protein